MTVFDIRVLANIRTQKVFECQNHRDYIGMRMAVYKQDGVCNTKYIFSVSYITLGICVFVAIALGVN